MSKKKTKVTFLLDKSNNWFHTYIKKTNFGYNVNSAYYIEISVGVVGHFLTNGTGYRCMGGTGTEAGGASSTTALNIDGM